MKYECVIVKYHEVDLVVRVFARAGTVDKVESNGSIALVPENIERRIFLARGEKVMVDSDLASLYGVTTGNLNLAVKRNPGRFPEDFMFQLTPDEIGNLTLQNARSSWGGRRRQPYVFTEHGVAMLSSVLRSERAVQMNILIVRAFVRIRELVASQKDLAHRVEKLEEMQERHESVIGMLADDIEELRTVEVPAKRPIGFIASASELLS
jgi:ORF6N domain-containing protein